MFTIFSGSSSSSKIRRTASSGLPYKNNKNITNYPSNDMIISYVYKHLCDNCILPILTHQHGLTHSLAKKYQL